MFVPYFKMCEYNNIFPATISMAHYDVDKEMEILWVDGLSEINKLQPLDVLDVFPLLIRTAHLPISNIEILIDWSFVKFVREFNENGVDDLDESETVGWFDLLEFNILSQWESSEQSDLVRIINWCAAKILHHSFVSRPKEALKTAP